MPQANKNRQKVPRATVGAGNNNKIFVFKYFFPALSVLLAIALILVACVSRERRPSAGLKVFLDTYFSTWSARDMAGYKAHFDPAAQIYYMEKGKVLTHLPLEPFIAQQAQAHAVSRVPMSEDMTACRVLEDEKAASVSARWRLKRGSEIITGLDRYTLIRDAQGNWKIISLVFYEDERE